MCNTSSSTSGRGQHRRIRQPQLQNIIGTKHAEPYPRVSGAHVQLASTCHPPHQVRRIRNLLQGYSSTVEFAHRVRSRSKGIKATAARLYQRIGGGGRGRQDSIANKIGIRFDTYTNTNRKHIHEHQPIDQNWRGCRDN